MTEKINPVHVTYREFVFVMKPGILIAISYILPFKYFISYTKHTLCAD